MIARRAAAVGLGLLALGAQASAAPLPPREVGKVSVVGNLTASGSIGAAALVSDARIVTVNQTTGGLTLSLPNPADTAAMVALDVVNIGSASFTMYGRAVAVSTVLHLAWSGSAWIAEAASTSSPTVPSYKVANLPTSGNVDGQLAWASDGRALTYTATLVVGQQAAGAGTGVMCSWSAKNAAWAIVGTTLAPAA